MRKQDFDSALAELPSGVARFDPDGIPDGVNQINSSGFLTTFVDVLKSSPANSIGVIGQVFTLSSTQKALINNDANKVQQAFMQTLQSLSNGSTPAQVINAVVNFFHALF